MTNLRTFLLFIVLVCMTCCSNSRSDNGNKYVREACSVTHYRDLCIHSLSPFSNLAKHNSRRWAQAAVTVTVSEAKSAARYLIQLKASGHLRRRQGLALLDCIECFQDTMSNLQSSLGELTRLDTRTFDYQMGNVETWMSAALTFEDSCLDGFDGRRGKLIKLLRKKVLKASYTTSNALAIVNKLASAGGRSLTNP